MLTKEQIQFMKDNEKPFGLLTEEQQGWFIQAGYTMKMQEFDDDGWVDDDNFKPKQYISYAYRLSPDYEPEEQMPELPKHEYPYSLYNYLLALEKRIARLEGK